MNPHNITVDFEHALCAYTGAPYAVTTTSCTMALLLAVAWHMRAMAGELGGTCQEIEIPRRTYVGVPMSIIHAGGRPRFRDEQWSGVYQLKPLPVWDCARRFTSGMFQHNAHEGTGYVTQFQCVSFHAAKILGDTQGGAILHNSPQADQWLRKARFDGRTPGVAPAVDNFDMLGWHAYLNPDVAARLLFKLSVLSRSNPDLPNDDYPDLSKHPIFQ